MSMISLTYKILGYLLLVMVVIQILNGASGWHTPINVLTGMLFIGIGRWLQEKEDCENDRR